MSLLTVLIAFVIAIAFVLLIQGTVTLVAAWIVTGRRPALGDVIKAILLSIVAYVVVMIGGFQFHLKLGPEFGFAAGLGMSLLVLGIFMLLPLLISCWVFARCLDITLVQAFATNLLTWAIFVAISFFSTPYLPAEVLRPWEQLRQEKPAQLTQQAPATPFTPA